LFMSSRYRLLRRSRISLPWELRLGKPWGSASRYPSLIGPDVRTASGGNAWGGGRPPMGGVPGAGGGAGGRHEGRRTRRRMMEQMPEGLKVWTLVRLSSGRDDQPTVLLSASRAPTSRFVSRERSRRPLLSAFESGRQSRCFAAGDRPETSVLSNPIRKRLPCVKASRGARR